MNRTVFQFLLAVTLTVLTKSLRSGVKRFLDTLYIYIYNIYIYIYT